MKGAGDTPHLNTKPTAEMWSKNKIGQMGAPKKEILVKCHRFS